MITKVNGSAKYLVALVVVGLATGAAVLYLSPNPNNATEITTIVGFAGLLVKGLFDSMATARLSAKVTQAAQATAVVAAKTDLVAAKVDHAAAQIATSDAKLDVVHRAVNGINAAALLNQSKVSDHAGFDRGVEAMEAAVAATAPSEATPLVAPVYDPRDALPPTVHNMIMFGHVENQKEPKVFH
jgi:hypothetical protein